VISLDIEFDYETIKNQKYSFSIAPHKGLPTYFRERLKTPLLKSCELYKEAFDYLDSSRTTNNFGRPNPIQPIQITDYCFNHMVKDSEKMHKYIANMDRHYRTTFNKKYFPKK